MNTDGFEGKIEQASEVLAAGAFLVRSFSSTVPWWARLGYALAGTHLLRKSWFGGASAASAVAGLRGSPVGRVNLKLGKAYTIDGRVNHIKAMIPPTTSNPEIYVLSRKLVTARCGEDWCIKEKDHKGEVIACFDYVKRNVRYTWDPANYDAFQTGQKTLELKAGDCDDAVILLASLCMLLGHQVKLRVVHTQGFPTWNHIYLVVVVDGQDFPLDTTVNKPPGWEVPRSLMVQPPRDYPIPLKAR